MRIDLRNIPSEGLRIDTREPVSILDVKDEGAEFNTPIDVSILVNRTSNTLLINGEVKTTVGLTCSKCLRKFVQLLKNNNFSLTCDITGQTDVDITPNIREEILILLPVKPLCTRKCKGFCPQCGQDLNEKQCSCTAKGDVRWDKLGRINL